MKTPIFIVGTQRSGTTLLRLILNSHSQIAIPEEAGFLRPLLTWENLQSKFDQGQLRRVLSYLQENEIYKLWNYDNSAFFESIRRKKEVTLKELISELFLSYCRSEGKPAWGDKTPVLLRQVDLLYRLYPEAFYIHIVRDGRDVFDSWRKMDPTKGNVAVTALDWCYKLYRIERSFKRITPANRMTLRYEDLLESPLTAIQGICSAAGLEFEEQMLSFYKESNRYIGRHHSKLIFEPINDGNRFKWKKNLSDQEVEIYNVLAAHFLKKYGYEVEKTARPGTYLTLAASLLSGLPTKLASVLESKRALERALRRGGAVEQIKVGQMPDAAKNKYTSTQESEQIREERFSASPSRRAPFPPSPFGRGSG